jgi:DNA-binding response OmpR family regulator
MMDILVVEDHDGIAATLNMLLRRLDHDVRRVDRGADALTVPPADLILLDLGLPDIDGMTVLSIMRAAGSTTPVVIMTAGDEPGLRERALAAGADGFIAKPFAIGELIMAIDLAAIHAARLTTSAGAPSRMGERATAHSNHAAAA